jgi:hypothetical protein
MVQGCSKLWYNNSKYSKIFNQELLISWDTINLKKGLILLMISYVVAGEYLGWEVKQGIGGVMLARGFKKVKLNKENVEAYEVITDEHQKSIASGVARGIVGGTLLGGVGMLAGALSAKEIGIYQVAVQFKDGKKSLLKMEDAIYKRLVQDLF